MSTENKKGIYGTDFTKPVSVLIEDIRNQIVQARGTLHDVQFHDKAWQEQLECVAGLLTCGLISLASINGEIIAWEIKRDDAQFGPSLSFSPRGIGLDVCPGCFVCGATSCSEGASDYLNNIAAFVKSRVEGEEIVIWFRFFGELEGNTRRSKEGARLDFRDFEPNWIQVKVGACDKHRPNLEDLFNRTTVYKRIREFDIKAARNLAVPAEVAV